VHEQTPLFYAESVLRLLVRGGLVAEEDVLALADEHETLADRNPHQAEVRRDTAHQLRCALIDLEPPPTVDPASEMRAALLRKQIVERTRMLLEGE